jgi:glutamate synthase (NADPH/NADH) large chain
MISPFRRFSRRPDAVGLYDGAHEHDACGVAFVATMRGEPGHDIVELALTALRNLDHRGAVGADPDTGDGAGILTQVPDAFLREVVDFALPPRRSYAVGVAFLPDDDTEAAAAQAAVEVLAADEGLAVLGWRDVPITPDLVGATARSCQPRFKQLFVASAAVASSAWRSSGWPSACASGPSARRGCTSRRCRRARSSTRACSPPGQLEPFFPDLSDRRFATELAIVHSRFSTNTFPSWPLAHPFRLVAHNGEINTVKGNRNWMRARESKLASEVHPGRPRPALPDLHARRERLRELRRGARAAAPRRALAAALGAHDDPRGVGEPRRDGPRRRAFYEFHSMFMEPVGRAGVHHLHGRHADRRRPRPQRPAPVAVLGHGRRPRRAGQRGRRPRPRPARGGQEGRLQPGRMFLVDTDHGRIVDDEEIKRELAGQHPYDEWLHAGRIHLADLPEREHILHTPSSVTRRQQTFGYTEEELRLLLAPMARSGAEPIGSMGTDTPIAVLSTRPRLLFDYFTQLFAQVTNPPLDAIREELVTSLATSIGPEHNALAPRPRTAASSCSTSRCSTTTSWRRSCTSTRTATCRATAPSTVKGLYRVAGGGAASRPGWRRSSRGVRGHRQGGAHFVVLSDRDSTPSWPRSRRCC